MKHEKLEASLSIEHLDAHALYDLDATAWDGLSVNALVENPFYSREVILAGLDTIDRHTPIEALAIRGSGHTLLGLLPFRRRWLPFETADAACNLYQQSCTPLIRQEHAAAAITAWLDAAHTVGGIPRFWRFRHVDLESKMVELLDAALSRRSLCRTAVTRYTRPHLTRLKGGLESHIAQILPKGRFKGINRRIRRLSELGSLRFERAREPTLAARRLEQFLQLENSGWKGKRGSAFLANGQDAAFARAAYEPREGGGRLVTIDSLLLDERPIAISLNLQARDTAFTPKCAYDERYRRYSPGLVLDYMIVKAFYEERAMVDMDAATTQEGHVLSNLWNGWKSMGTLIVGPADWRVKVMAGWEEYTHISRERAKSLLSRSPLRRLRKGLRVPKSTPWVIGILALSLE